jgi:hypothetical protein
MWQASHLGAVDSLIIADVGSNDMDQIVEVACHEMTADDFGYRCDRRLKFVEMILVLTVERDLDKDRGSEPDPLAVDCRVVATDDAGGLKSANAAQTGAGGEVDPFGDGGVCHAPVALEQGDDLLVGRIKIEHAQSLRQECDRRRNRALRHRQAHDLSGIRPVETRMLLRRHQR